MDENHKPIHLSEELGAFIWETVKVVIISLAIIIPVRYYLIQPFFVRGDSMKPNFQDEDYILVDKLDYRLNKPERGDVIVFRYPLDPKEYFIKRIIALPEETINIQANTVTIYNTQNPEGFVLDESYLPETQETVGTMRVKLDANEYFVMGDNRLFSSDSRRWGPLNRSYIAGRGWLRLWPLNKIEIINDVQYSPVK